MGIEAEVCALYGAASTKEVSKTRKGFWNRVEKQRR